MASKKQPQKAFGGISDYIQQIQAVAYGSVDADWEKKCLDILNGGVATELRRTISLKTRRKFGAFFTGSKLAQQLTSLLPAHQPSDVYYDPTCGMGDLLLAAAKRLPLKKSLRETLQSWGAQLSGSDLHSEFIEGTKLRLLILARMRHQSNKSLPDQKIDYFPYIHTGNGLKANLLLSRATYVLINPPFGAVPAPSQCSWASGKITEAALFMASVLERASPKTQVLSILPDVLRSGSFSKQWRNAVSKLAEIHLVRPYGIFDESADVDVFLAHFVRRTTPETPLASLAMGWPNPISRAKSVISDHFDVHIGRVVPHRDKVDGPKYAFIHARSVQPWSVMEEFNETLRHLGKPYLPPFVVIRRTSRPEQEYRAVATIISGQTPVAVENHLIVCEPKDKNLSTCKQLADQLKSETANKYLNLRIRCRHLTVTAVRDIPFKKATK